MSSPPTPPLKSSQRLETSIRPVATVRAVEESARSDSTYRPSMRRSPEAQTPIDDPRRLVQGAVRQAASEGEDSPIIDRGRPRISIPQRQDSTRSPPGTRTPVEINWEDGFSYINQEEITELPGAPAPLRSAASKRPTLMSVSPSFRSRAGSFESGKPRGLSFHEAREFMRSGRGLRPGSWHEAPLRTASIGTSDHGTQGSTLPSGSRSPHGNRSRSPSPSTRPRTPVNGDTGEDDVYSDGTVLRPLRSHPPQTDDHSDTLPAIALSATPPLDHESQTMEKSSGSSSVSTPSWQSSLRKYLGIAFGEFLGTTSFLFMAFGGLIAASNNATDPAVDQTGRGLPGSNISSLLYTSLAFGFSYMINVWTFFHISQGFFNPAVTLALFITGSQGVLQSLLLLVAQLAGSIAASALTLGVFQTIAPARTFLATGVSIPRGLFIEAILTAQLVLIILLFAGDKHRATATTPVIIGLALFTSELVALFWTGGSLNPARSFGPNVVSWTWGPTHWIYWAGPLLGSVIAVIIKRVLEALSTEIGIRNECVSSHLFPSGLVRQDPARGDYVGTHDIKGLRITTRGQDPLANGADLTGVISLWQPVPENGRFRGHSVSQGAQKHERDELY